MNTGGPAFPVPDTYHPSGQVQFGSSGMTLLDWMAGQALKLGSAVSRNPQAAAIWSYEIASAMLAEKARREGVVKESQATDHFPDATKKAELEKVNRELAEALEAFNYFAGGIYAPPGSVMRDHLDPVLQKAHAALAKAKEVA